MKAQMFRIFILPVVSCCMLMSTACGDIIISIESKTITAGSANEYVDVFIEGDTGDTLGQFGYQFDITGANASSGDLQFQAVQSLSEQGIGTPFPYVFFGNADPGAINSEPLPLVNTTLIGGDVVGPPLPGLPLDFVSIDGKFLLARLELQHVGPFNPGSYDFNISLNTTSLSTFFDRDVFSNFYTSGQISSPLGSGTITVNAAAVPEPSSMAILAVGGLAAVLRYRRRKQIRAT